MRATMYWELAKCLSSIIHTHDGPGLGHQLPWCWCICLFFTVSFFDVSVMFNPLVHFLWLKCFPPLFSGILGSPRFFSLVWGLLPVFAGSSSSAMWQLALDFLKTDPHFFLFYILSKGDLPRGLDLNYLNTDLNGCLMCLQFCTLQSCISNGTCCHQISCTCDFHLAVLNSTFSKWKSLSSISIWLLPLFSFSIYRKAVLPFAQPRNLGWGLPLCLQPLSHWPPSPCWFDFLFVSWFSSFSFILCHCLRPKCSPLLSVKLLNSPNICWPLQSVLHTVVWELFSKFGHAALLGWNAALLSRCS